MSDNKTDNKPEVKPEAKWYEIPLRDWSIIAAVFYFAIGNAGSKAGSEEKLAGFTKGLTDLNANVKELGQKYESELKELRANDNKKSVEIEVLKSRVQSLENKK